jgi:cytochrome b561
MLYLHPLIQLAAIVLSFYVLYLGFQRFQASHLKKKAVFPWKKHVKFGLTTLIVLFLGFIGGIVMTYINWSGYLFTTHGKFGVLIAVLIVIGLSTGLYMDKNKKKRTVLPLIHGINNFVLVVLCIVQTYFGFHVLKSFVLGI